MSVSGGERSAGFADFLSGMHARPHYQDMKVSLLILAPASSATTKLEEQRKIQAQVKGSQLWIIKAKGHEIYVEKVDECHEV